MFLFTHALLAALVLFAASATAQEEQPRGYPFGLSMGMTFDEVKALKGFEITKIDSVGYRRSLSLKLAETPPKKSTFDLFGMFSEEPDEADFANFFLYFTPDHGLFKVWAWTDEMDVGNGGETIMKKYQAIKKQLSDVYSPIGGYRMQRSFNANAWESPEDWTRRFLNYNGRAFIAEWKDMRGLGGKPFPNNVTNIKLSIVVSTIGMGKISITTEFDNTNRAYDAIDRNE